MNFIMTDSVFIWTCILFGQYWVVWHGTYSYFCHLSTPHWGLRIAYNPVAWVLVYFSKDIYIAQLSRMSHCSTEATLLFQFMPKTAIGNVFVA